MTHLTPNWLKVIGRTGAEAINYVRFALENGFYSEANRLAPEIDKADSEVINYYHACGRDGSYSGVAFVKAAEGNYWYVMTLYGKPSKHDYAKP